MADSKTYTIRERTGIISVGALLIFLYALCVALVVVGFSAYVIRTDWNGVLTTNGGEVKELDNLRFLVRRDAELEALIAKAQGDIQIADAAIRTASQTEDSLKANLNRIYADSQEIAARLHASLSGIAQQLEADDKLRLEGLLKVSDSAELDQAVSRAMFQVPSLEFRPDIDPQDRKAMLEPVTLLTARLMEMRSEISALDVELQNAQSNTQRAHEDRSFHLKGQNSHRDALVELRAKLPIYSEHRTRWISLADAQWWNPLPKLVAAPTILLTLMVTIAAGALGTLVAYSRTTFLNQTVPSGSRLLIILGEGIAAAIGIFLFAGAGMLVLSQGGGPDGRLELSPFTVAFLAFLSGFMAESAFAKISGFGDDLFRGGPKDDAQNGASDDGTTAGDGDGDDTVAKPVVPPAG